MYTVKQAAEMTGLSVHTVRFYDDNNLIQGIVRNSSNQRMFTDEAIEWLYICKVMRRAGLSLKEIKKYGELYSEGDRTIPQRMEIIRQRYENAERELESIKIRMKALETKLHHYENLLQGKPDVWTHDFVIDSIEKEKRSIE